jgi:hypothetical protein
VGRKLAEQVPPEQIAMPDLFKLNISQLALFGRFSLHELSCILAKRAIQYPNLSPITKYNLDCVAPRLHTLKTGMPALPLPTSIQPESYFQGIWVSGHLRGLSCFFPIEIDSYLNDHSRSIRLKEIALVWQIVPPGSTLDGLLLYVPSPSSLATKLVTICEIGATIEIVVAKPSDWTSDEESQAVGAGKVYTELVRREMEQEWKKLATATAGQSKGYRMIDQSVARALTSEPDQRERFTEVEVG